MLKQRVVVKDPNSKCFGQIGIVVAESTGHQCNLSFGREETVCKVLVSNMVSNWIPDKYLETVRDHTRSA